MKTKLSRTGRAILPAAQGKITTAFFYRYEQLRRETRQASENETVPSAAARARFGRSLVKRLRARALTAGEKRVRVPRPSWTDPETRIVWRQMGRGRNWKDGIPPWARL